MRTRRASHDGSPAQHEAHPTSGRRLGRTTASTSKASSRRHPNDDRATRSRPTRRTEDACPYAYPPPSRWDDLPVNPLRRNRRTPTDEPASQPAAPLKRPNGSVTVGCGPCNNSELPRVSERWTAHAFPSRSRARVSSIIRFTRTSRIQPIPFRQRQAHVTLQAFRRRITSRFRAVEVSHALAFAHLQSQSSNEPSSSS